LIGVADHDEDIGGRGSITMTITDDDIACAVLSRVGRAVDCGFASQICGFTGEKMESRSNEQSEPPASRSSMAGQEFWRR